MIVSHMFSSKTNLILYAGRRNIKSRVQLSCYCNRKAVSSCQPNGVDDNILLRRDNDPSGVTTLTLNKPEHCNLLSHEMLDALQFQLENITNEKSIHAVIIKASGKAFSAGHDLREVQINTEELFKRCCQVMISLNKLPQPVIAMVQGVATAAGCQLVASCDLVVASENARFGVSGINSGLFCSTPAVALSRSIPRKQAMHMLLTGDLISAHEALSYGLVNKVVPLNELNAETSKLAAAISAKSSFAVRLGKKMFYEQLGYNNLSDAYDFATERVVCNMQHPDVKRGINNFLSK